MVPPLSFHAAGLGRRIHHAGRVDGRPVASPTVFCSIRILVREPGGW